MCEIAIKKKIYISVVIPAYNAEKYLSRAIRSVLEQTYLPDEIIVVDDGSTDGTRAVAESFGEAVRCVYQKNAGESGARNRGIQESQGNWIAFLDADDEWLPNRLASQIAVLDKQPELVWISGNYFCYLNKTVQKSTAVDIKKVENYLENKNYFEDYFNSVIRFNVALPDVMLIRKDVLEEVGMFQYKKKIGPDVDLWWRIAYRHPMLGYVTEPTAIYYLDIPTSVSQNGWDFDGFTDLIDRHLALSKQAGKEKDFERLARYMIERWMRAAWFAGDVADVKQMLGYYRRHLRWWFAAVMKLMLVWPGLSYRMCKGLSRLNRRFHLRKTVLRENRGAALKS